MFAHFHGRTAELIKHPTSQSPVTMNPYSYYWVPALRRPTRAKGDSPQVDAPECKRQPMRAKGDPQKANPQGDAFARLLLQHSNKQAECTRDLAQSTDSTGFRTAMHPETPM